MSLGIYIIAIYSILCQKARGMFRPVATGVGGGQNGTLPSLKIIKIVEIDVVFLYNSPLKFGLTTGLGMLNLIAEAKATTRFAL